MYNIVLCTFLIVSFLVPATPYNFKDHEEGPCGQYTPQKDINKDWLVKNDDNADYHFFPAGNQYHLYRLTGTGVPDYENISEEDFLQNACLHGSVNFVTGIGELYAFGLGNICNFQLKSTDTKGVQDVVYLDTAEQLVSRVTVTLTDNKSFLFLASCWEDTQQRGWLLVSSTTMLDPNTTQLITNHATGLGFDPAKFVLFPADSCGEE